MDGRIRTMRKYNRYFPNLLIYEWEDQIKNELDLQWYYSRDYKIQGRYILSKIEKYVRINLSDIGVGNVPTFSFDLEALPERKTIHNPNVSLCIVDFYIPKDQLHRFCKYYSQNRKVFISSLQAYDIIKKECPYFDCYHLPLTLPNKYEFDLESIPNKKIDIAVLGHTSKILIRFLERYKSKYSINCFYRKKIGNSFYVISSKNGEMYKIDTREEYFKFLKQVKIVLYNTSGIDESRFGTFEYHQVTPRFLEYLSCGCHVISRYDKNSDTDYFQLDQMTCNVKNYTEFEEAMDKALSTYIDVSKYTGYLSKHYTSSIIPAIKDSLN